MMLTQIERWKSETRVTSFDTVTRPSLIIRLPILCLTYHRKERMSTKLPFVSVSKGTGARLVILCIVEKFV